MRNFFVGFGAGILALPVVLLAAAGLGMLPTNANTAPNKMERAFAHLALDSAAARCAPHLANAVPPTALRENVQADLKELRSLAVPVRSIDLSDEDFSDLVPLKDALTGVTVLGLGEATHADGAAYRAKVRLAKFLHQIMGFDVLIWEAGFLDAYYMNQELRDPAISLASAKAKLMNDTWAASENVDGLFAYARSSWQASHPLQMAGMNGGHPDLGFDNFGHLLDGIVRNLPEHTVNRQQRERIDALSRRVLGDPRQAAALSPPERYLQRHALEDLLSIVHRRRHEGPLASGEREEADFAEEALHATLLDESVKYYYGKYLSTRRGMWARRSNAIREKNMAELFFWLRVHRFAGKKIIIWAATDHLARKTSSNRPKDPGDGSTLGDYVWERIGRQFYTVAFTTSSGKIGIVDTGSKEHIGDLAPAATGGFEDVATKLALPFFFVDLRHTPPCAWLKGKYSARPIGYSPQKKQWSQLVDSFFYFAAAEPDLIRCSPSCP